MKPNVLLPKNEYDEVFSKAVRICIDLLFNLSNRVLVGKRVHEPYKDMYGLPGGRMFFGENVNEAIQRISQEELGVSIKRYRLYDYLEYPQEIDQVGKHSISMVFMVHTDDNLPSKSDAFSEITHNHRVDSDLIIPQQNKLINQYLEEFSGRDILRK